MDPEEWVREPGRRGRVGKIDVDYVKGDEGKEDVEAQRSEAPVSVGRPEDTVMVRVEKITVLLKDSLVRVFVVPGIVCGALRGSVGGGYVGASSAWCFIREAATNGYVWLLPGCWSSVSGSLFMYGCLSFVTGADSMDVTIGSSVSPFKSLARFVWCGITTSAYVELIVCGMGKLVT